MSIYLHKGDLTKYKEEYIKLHPDLNAYNMPLYVMEDFEKHVQKVGEMEIHEAYDWIIKNHISNKKYGTRNIYRRIYRRLFQYICSTNGSEFTIPDGAEIIIHYNLEKGIL